MKSISGGRPRAHLVTEAQEPKSQDISHRERRYLIMMAIRLVCFLAAIVLFAEGGGWLALIPAVGAVVIPYIAVVFANAGREPTRARGLHDFQPPHLPERQPRALPSSAAPPRIVGFVTYGDPERSPESGRGGPAHDRGGGPPAEPDGPGSD